MVAVPGPVERTGPERATVVTWVAVLSVATVAWLLTGSRMAGMADGPGTALGTFGFFLTGWVLMTAAMMLPSIAPVVAAFGTAQRERGGTTAAAGPSSFVAGYLLVWALTGALAYAAVDTVGALSGAALTWQRGGRWPAAAVLMVAALYELTPVKRACLTRCRAEGAPPAPGGAAVGVRASARAGVRHGLWCLGSCWALMAALFALGIMSPVWMAVIGLAVAAEKLLPWRRTAVGLVAVTVALLAVGLAVAPRQVPGLTTPGPDMSTMTMH